MPVLTITIRNKIATYTGDVPYVCGNSDYTVIFTFDEEWDEYTQKTARFVYGSSYTDVLFEGNECQFPVIERASMVAVGVFAGNLRTSTGASVRACLSIRSGIGAPVDPEPDVYDQIAETLSNQGKKIDELDAKIDGMTPGGGGTGGITQDDLEAAVNEALDKAAASGAFDGQDGVTPHIGTNGNWYIGSYDTGVKAAGVTVAYVDNGKTSSGVQFTTIHLTDGTTITIHDGARGANGTSVTVSSVAESDASGGENVVAFSDGKRLVVKNGKDGKTPVKGVDYYTDADKSDMVQAVIDALPVYNGEVVCS